LTPGALLLGRVAERYGVRFSKDKGDSERLASFVTEEAIPYELKAILKAVTSA